MLNIDYSRNKKLSKQAKDLLKAHYCREGEDFQDAFARAAQAYCYDDLALAQRIYDYASQGWFMFASPVLSNAPAVGEKVKGLPISCFLNYVDDSIDGLNQHTVETRWMSVKGGGIGGHWSDVRAVSDKAPGPIPFLRTVDADILAYSQGGTRRGSYAAYLDVSHPDIIEFLSFRTPTGGDINRKCLNLHHGINLTDSFLKAVQEGSDWELLDPHSNKVTEIIPARELWAKIIKARFRTGEPYLNYIDEANRHLPSSLKMAGLKIHGSNLCNEIHLPTNKDRSAVCCLSSVNLEKWEEWKDTNMVYDLVEFLDNVLQFFIDNAPDELSRAKFSAQQERSIGLGAMGYHAYLQKKGWVWQEAAAMNWNDYAFYRIKFQAEVASARLAVSKGTYKNWTRGEGDLAKRNAHLLAVAPNANNSIILNTSPSVEPHAANAYTHRSRIGSYLVKNKYLKRVLKKYDMDTKEVWEQIISDNGSVQGLDFLTSTEKKVFLTANELDQLDIVRAARIRQQYICQGQSINLFFKPKAEPKYVNQVHLAAFSQEGDGVPLKGLYYLRTESGATTDKLIEKKERDVLQDGVVCDINNKECVPCQG